MVRELPLLNWTMQKTLFSITAPNIPHTEQNSQNRIKYNDKHVLDKQSELLDLFALQLGSTGVTWRDFGRGH